MFKEIINNEQKKLLSEAQVRRFMGLAGLNPLNEMADYKKG